MTKTEITNKINILKKHGWKILNFNSNRRFNTGHFQDMTDYLLLHKNKGIVFAEVKRKGDTLKPGQIEFKEIIDILENLLFVDICFGMYLIRYRLITETNVEDFIKELI